MVIAIWGGVGSGKSTVLEILRDKYDADIIQADAIAHELYNPNMTGATAVAKIAGRQVLDADGRVDRKKLGDMLYADQELRKKINDVIHPMVIECIKTRIVQSKKMLIAVESALPYKEASDLFDEIWYVYSSESIRIERLMMNRNYSKQRAMDIINSQMSDEEFRKWASTVIDNSSDIENLEEQIKKQLDGRLNI